MFIDHTRGRKLSDQQQVTSPVSPLALAVVGVAEPVDPYDEQHNEEHSELSYASAFGTPTLSIPSLTDSLQYTETTV